MQLKAAVLIDKLKADVRLAVEGAVMAGADASVLSESEVQLASALISVNSPLPFRLQLKPH